MKAMLIVLVVGLAMSVGAASALAGAPMAPAMATVEKGQWSLGFEYAFENITLSASGHCTETVIGVGSDRYHQKFDIDDLETNMLFGRLTYGLCDEWDVFVRLGVTDGQSDIDTDGAGIITGTGAGADFDGSFGFAWGVGTRATFWTSGPWSVAGLAQATWLDPDDSSFHLTREGYPNETVRGKSKLDYLQTQFSLAAIYQEESWGVWVGPFVQLVDGDLDLDARFVLDGTTEGTLACCADVEEESQIGVHAGAACGLSPDLACWVEGQFTADSWLLGVGAIIRPQ